jgi:hypothetical protein
MIPTGHNSWQLQGGGFSHACTNGRRRGTLGR